MGDNFFFFSLRDHNMRGTSQPPDSGLRIFPYVLRLVDFDYCFQLGKFSTTAFGRPPEESHASRTVAPGCPPGSTRICWPPATDISAVYRTSACGRRSSLAGWLPSVPGRNSQTTFTDTRSHIKCCTCTFWNMWIYRDLFRRGLRNRKLFFFRCRWTATIRFSKRSWKQLCSVNATRFFPKLGTSPTIPAQWKSSKIYLSNKVRMI